MSTGPTGTAGVAASDGSTGPTGAGGTAAGNVTGAVTPDAKTDPQAPPKFLRPKFERMPAELKQLKNWVLWVPIWNGSKWTKRPIQLSGFGASTTNPKHWSSFDDVKQAYERAVQRGYIEVREKDKPPQHVPIGGVGFVFDGQPDEDGLVFAGVDFDKVISGRRDCFSGGRAHQETWIVQRAERIGRRIACDRQSAAVAKRRRPWWRRDVHRGAFFHDDWARTGKRPDRRRSR